MFRKMLAQSITLTRLYHFDSDTIAMREGHREDCVGPRESAGRGSRTYLCPARALYSSGPGRKVLCCDPKKVRDNSRTVLEYLPN